MPDRHINDPDRSARRCCRGGVDRTVEVMRSKEFDKVATTFGARVRPISFRFLPDRTATIAKRDALAFFSRQRGCIPQVREAVALIASLCV